MSELDDLRARVEAVRAKRAEREQVHADQVEKRKLEEELALYDIEGELGAIGRDIQPIYCAKTGAMAVFKAPKQVAYQRIQEKGMSGKPVTTQDIIQYVKPCLVYPRADDGSASWKAFEAMLDVSPAMLADALTACGVLAGASAEEKQGK